MLPPNNDTPWTRLKDLVSYAFTKEDYNDPHRPPAPPELKEFGRNTMLLLGAGLVFGGVQQWIQERRQPAPTIPTGYSKAEAAKLLGELNTRRLIRVMNSTIRGGMWCGWLGALYFGVEGISEYVRNVRDPLNTVMGAWASSAVFGFASIFFLTILFQEEFALGVVGGPGIMSRFQSSSISVFLAGLVAYPIGYLQVHFKDQTQPKVDHGEAKAPPAPYPVRDYDVVGAVIGKLDDSLKSQK